MVYYLLFKGTITAAVVGANAAVNQAEERNKNAIFKDYVASTDCISEISNAQLDHVKVFM